MDKGAKPASPESTITQLSALITAVRAGRFPPEHSQDAVASLLGALAALRKVRDQLAEWEPELIAAARAAGASWTALAPALGVASRQAAERRYLRLQPNGNGNGELTREGRVRATRDRRAGERAVTAWARENSAELRQVAGQVSGLPGLSEAGQRDAELLHAELGGDDTSTLLQPLSTMQSYLSEEHSDLAGRIGALTANAERQRDDAASRRRHDQRDGNGHE